MKDLLSKIKTALKKGIDWMRTDGMLHCSFSALIFLVLAKPCGAFFACMITLAIGVGKEIYDSKTDGVAEFHDIVCDAIGIVLGMLVYCIYLI